MVLCGEKKGKDSMENINFVLGDIHLAHNRLHQIEYSKSFYDVEEYENTLIYNYNKVVKSKSSVVLFLGDLGFKEGVDRVLPKLMGYKILIKGNHDKYSNKYYKQYFDEIYDTPQYYNKRLVFSHEPIMVENGILNVHGHTHRIKLKSENHFNACPEWHNYNPIPIKVFLNMLANIPKPDKRFLHEWYSNIYDDYRPQEHRDKLEKDIKKGE